MRYNNLNDWLKWQETLNPCEIELGLDRISAVLKQAGLSNKFDCPLITVAGTNGKGSVVAMLESIAQAAGLNVCSYTSPHLFRYNERIKVNGLPVDDEQLCEAFERIDQARLTLSATAQSGVSHQLTYFEFGTLAAIDLFFRPPSELQPDLIILEVGLGGRLDAVNIMDADVCVITSIAIDHIDWLGDDREAIGFEKAGIFRSDATVICGDSNPPASVINRAQQLQCEFVQIEKDYSVANLISKGSGNDESWTLKSDFGGIAGLPQPSLKGDFQKSNAATAILALQVLRKKELLFSNAAPATEQQTKPGADALDQAAKSALKDIQLPGRFQQINIEPQVYVDVAHNPQAAEALASQLKSAEGDLIDSTKIKTWAIAAMLSDKDVEGVIGRVNDSIDHWCFAGLEHISRGMTAAAFINRLVSSTALFSADIMNELGSELGSELERNQCKIVSDEIMLANTVVDACRLVMSKADKDDRIIIFGSFYTVSEAMQFFHD
jgi:dihydrofolate synthase/folylpolyglutamate synthase